MLANAEEEKVTAESKGSGEDEGCDVDESMLGK